MHKVVTESPPDKQRVVEAHPNSRSVERQWNWGRVAAAGRGPAAPG
jgi:hypothetical protein